MIENKLHQLVNLEDTYIGEAPIAIDNCQWIQPAGGRTTVHFGKDNYDRPAFSIYVRGTNNEETCTRTQAIFKKIRNFSDAECAILIRRLPQFVGKDDKHRSVYVFSIEYQSSEY